MKGLSRILRSRTGWFRTLFRKTGLSSEQWRHFSDTVFRCTLCGNCEEVCPVGIHLKDLWLSLRHDLVASRFYPNKIDRIRDNLQESHNVFDEDNEERADWVEDMKGAPDFEPLAAAFKRVVNIIKKNKGGVQTQVNENLFTHTSEKALLSAFRNVENQVSEMFAAGDFEKALLKIASLKDGVDAFFDDVLVMDEDLQVRNNRLALLGNIAALFDQFADFSKLA